MTNKTPAERSGGDRFGIQRVLGMSRVLPQQALKLDASLPIYETEILVEVQALNIDSASFHQIKESCKNDASKIKEHILEIVKVHGKHQNPVTGSGGMLMGSIEQIGSRFFDEKKPDVKVGDRVVSLVSLTLTPLFLKKINTVYLKHGRADVEGEAIFFQSGVYSKIPSDIPEGVCLAALDVCGAPAHVKNICRPGDTVAIIGGAGKSGILSLFAARQAIGKDGLIIALDYSPAALQEIKELAIADVVEVCNAQDAVPTYELVKKMTNNKMANVVINLANVPNTEMASILCAKPDGIVYFFGMATSFTRAALGAEGVASSAKLMIGNGYAHGHAEYTLQILRESKEIRKVFENRYGAS